MFHKKYGSHVYTTYALTVPSNMIFKYQHFIYIVFVHCEYSNFVYIEHNNLFFFFSLADFIVVPMFCNKAAGTIFHDCRRCMYKSHSNKTTLDKHAQKDKIWIYHLLKLIFPVPSSIVKETSVTLSTLFVTNPKTLTYYNS